MDLRSRRATHRRPAHGRGPAFPEGGVSSAPGPRRRVGRPHLSEPLERSAVARFAAGGVAGKVPAVADGESPAGTSNRVRREGKLETADSELQRMPALSE